MSNLPFINKESQFNHLQDLIDCQQYRVKRISNGLTPFSWRWTVQYGRQRVITGTWKKRKKEKNNYMGAPMGVFSVLLETLSLVSKCMDGCNWPSWRPPGTQFFGEQPWRGAWSPSPCQFFLCHLVQVLISSFWGSQTQDWACWTDTHRHTHTRHPISTVPPSRRPKKLRNSPRLFHALPLSGLIIAWSLSGFSPWTRLNWPLFAGEEFITE